MIHKKIVLSADRNVSMKTYLIENSEELLTGIKRPLVIICPGGGYAFLSDREAEPIALSYVNAGYHAIVLSYGIGEHAVMPGPLCDLADAVYYVRSHADEWYVNPDQVFVSGFSAGAHVAGSLCTLWNHKELLEKYKDDLQIIRPSGAILCYPVLDLHSSTKRLDIGIQPGTKPSEVDFAQRHPNMPEKEYFIFDKKENRYFIDFEVAMNAYIFGGQYTAQQEDFYSLQNQVQKDTPPIFLWHTAKDGLIYPSNSLLFAGALDSNQVPYELHIFGEGDHGLSLGNYVTSNYPHETVPCVQDWITLAIRWLNRQTGIDRITP